MFSPTYNRQSNATEDNQRTEQTPLELTFFTPYKASPARSLLLSPHAFTSPRHTSPRRRKSPRRPRDIKLDIISHLPPEIVVKIFHLLLPEDLCRVCAVCQRWNLLAQLDGLAKIRRRFLKTCREKFNENKENYYNSQSHHHTTPHRTQYSSSPLNAIQPTTRSHMTPRDYRTPSPTPLLKEVSELHLADHTEIRRCLFPEQLASQEDCQTAGKKVNKSRLKRL